MLIEGIETEVYVNIMKQGKHVVVAACDAKLLGKVLKYGKLKFEVRKEFYGGSIVNLGEAIKLLRRGTIINLVGEKVVDEALKHGFVHPDAIIDLSGIPHAQKIRL